MPPVSPPPYPQGLTVNFWNKAKGVIARVSGVKTGITEELQNAEKLFKAAPFASLDLTKSTQGLSTEKLKEFRDDYLRKYHPIFKKLTESFYSLSSFLKEKATEFEKDEKLQKFAPAVKVMAEEANKFSYAIAWGTVSDSNTRELDKRIASAEESDKVFTAALGKIKPTIEKSAQMLSGYKTSPPTAKVYRSPLWKEHLRNIGVYINTAEKVQPGIKAKFAEPLKIASKQWVESKLPDKDEEVPDLIKKDIILVGKFKAIADEL